MQITKKLLIFIASNLTTGQKFDNSLPASEIDGADFPVCPVEGQRIRPWNSDQPDDEFGKLGVRQLKLTHEPLQPFIIRLLAGGSRKGCGQCRHIDSLHSIERYEKAGEEVDARPIPR